MLGRQDLDFDNLHVLDVFGSQISGSPGSQISKFPDSQISRPPDSQTLPVPPAPDELSDPNLTPLPTHPGTKYVARTLAATIYTTKVDRDLTIWVKSGLEEFNTWRWVLGKGPLA